ncbi:unnamed protein product [Microthlaspi erraticum]|uniref:Uncharacterized protein n=1 Tax=Microthlaspi erraticum TaxID=1685480 RepID=A0A6D2KNV9_9BRAS|nr:unnamed protein product [Microthlaspi erraticum]
MGREEHGGTWHGRSSTGYAKEEGEAILKTSSTIYSTNRSSSSTRPAKLQLDRAEKSTAILHMEVMEIAGKDPLRAPISLALEMRSKGLDGLVWAMILWPPRFDSHWLTPCF